MTLPSDSQRRERRLEATKTWGLVAILVMMLFIAAGVVVIFGPKNADPYHECHLQDCGL